MRRRLLLVAALAYALTALAVLQAQDSDSSRVRGEAVKAHSEEDATPSATPKKKKKSPSPSPSAKKKKSEAKKKSDSDEEASATPKSKKKKKGAKSASPSPSKKKKKGEEKKLDADKAPDVAPPLPSAVPEDATANTPVAAATPAQAALVENEPAADLTIQKNERPPTFWERLFGRRSSGGGGGSYSFVNRSIREAIDRAPVQRGRWQFIVVHNSGTRQGNAKAFDYYHKHVRGMQNGLAYHFVIGNGTSSGNGQIEIGDRWRRQINGGHVHSDYLNNIALGICLVGDFNRDQPSRQQLSAAEELIRYLRQRCGRTSDGRVIPVKPHREVNPPRWATDCPGDDFPYQWFRRF